MNREIVEMAKRAALPAPRIPATGLEYDILYKLNYIVIIMWDVQSRFALTRIGREVPIGVATLHESAFPSSHRADDDFSALPWDFTAWIWVIYEF